jgi:hypothetical protein
MVADPDAALEVLWGGRRHDERAERVEIREDPVTTSASVHDRRGHRTKDFLDAIFAPAA